MKTLPLLACLALAAMPLPASAQQRADKMADQFTHPPESAKPWTWWHWISGNISKPGITADLEAMKKIGLGGAQIFTVDQSAVKGPVKFMSPEWKALVQYALSEANRLHLVISMEGCDGWSESGGPWVPVSESMQKVVWSERQVAGGAKVPLDLPQPDTVLNYYEDIAVYAFPTLEGSGPVSPSKVTASDPAYNGKMLNVANPGEPLWIQFEYTTPATFHSVDLEATAERPSASWEVQSSDDGVRFKKLGSVGTGGGAFPKPVTARYFRIWRPRGPAKLKQISIKSLSFGGAVLDNIKARSGMSPSIAADEFSSMDLSPKEVIDPKSLVNLTGRHEWDAPPGNWTIIRIGHTSTGATTHPSTAAGLECNKLSPVAVQHHIENMFGPVFAGSPSMVGNTFRNILLDSWEAGCENWTPQMAADFQQRRGYDLTPWLPALTGKIIGSAELTQRFLWDYRRTLADLVAQAHYGTIQAYAHQHGMGLASEAAGIGMPTVADQLLCKKYTDIPMGEFWTSSSRDANIDDTKEAASAAHIYGRQIAAAESFTSAPRTAAWTNDPYSLKALGDEEFCLGINRYCFHRYAHQPWLDRLPGMSMGPWGINFERTNTWWEPGSAWISYITRCQELLQQGFFQADLCYFYGEGAPNCVHHNALNPVPPRGYDYDVCNADVLLNDMAVQNGLITLPSGMRYRVLVLPPSDRMTVPALKKVASLIEAGAIVYGPKPLHSPSLAGGGDDDLTKIADEVWGPCDGTKVTERAFGKGKIFWGEPLQNALGVGPDFSFTQGDLLFIHRQDWPADIYFVSNQQPNALTTQCTFRVGSAIPELWHPDTGVCETAALYQSGMAETTLPLHLDPTGSVFVIFRRRRSEPAPVAAMKLDGTNIWTTEENPPATLPTATKGAIEFTAFNAGSYELTTGSGKAMTADVAPMPEPRELTGPWQIQFPPKLGAPDSATFDHLMSWTESPDDGVKYFSGTATYQKDFPLPQGFTGKNRRVYLDLGSVKNLARVILNGKALGVLWKVPFRTDITDAVKDGNNHLEVKITNLWPNRLIGDQKLPEDKRITWASVSLYKADSPLLPSGLLGPVTVIPAQTVSILSAN
jgi:hypothetical protein